MAEETATTEPVVVIEYVERTVRRPKESAEIFNALVELVKDIKEGKDVALIATENLTGLLAAVDGYDKLDDELKAEGFYASAGLFTGDMLEIFLKKSDDEPTQPAA